MQWSILCPTMPKSRKTFKIAFFSTYMCHKMQLWTGKYFREDKIAGKIVVE